MNTVVSVLVMLSLYLALPIGKLEPHDKCHQRQQIFTPLVAGSVAAVGDILIALITAAAADRSHGKALLKLRNLDAAYLLQLVRTAHVPLAALWIA
ncbi:hypothetical protein F3Y22_tig00111330pilonHSYRG00458 [Hibiscus syriacus]|uniref:Uncharacterized protein n=1 Tax=Hibiscus syriacus TaxID=106335 RepID=A0A6A2YQ45_HIBSY|nr:hypothetical protein F3Y22_tig00111330pilonHSYRG00458 [Hibiscus syriacus]